MRRFRFHAIQSRLSYTPAEAGAAIGGDKSWFYRQLYSGNLPVSASFGKRAMIPAAERERFVKYAWQL
jgi:hypothetical protein